MRSKLARAGVAGVSLLGAGVAVAVVNQLNDLQRVDAVDDRAFTHSDQLTIRSSDFDDVFEAGDEFFDTEFNLLDGGAANVGRGQRYSREASATFFRAALEANGANPSDTRAPDLIATLENLVLFFEE